jgi:hypothetical protein
MSPTSDPVAPIVGPLDRVVVLAGLGEPPRRFRLRVRFVLVRRHGRGSFQGDGVMDGGPGGLGMPTRSPG